MPKTPGPNDVGLPVREFMYTLDQIAYLLNMSERTLIRSYIHFQGRSTGPLERDKMLAIDISPDDAPTPEWRVAETHLKRWMRFKGWKIYDRGYVT